MSIVLSGYLRLQQEQPRSQLQPFHGDPDNPPEGTNAIAQARTPQARPSGLVWEKKFYYGFSLRGGSFPAVVSLLLLLAVDIELNPGPNCYACRKPTHGDIPPRGSDPPHRAPNTLTLICDSCQQPIRTGTRPLICGAPDCPPLVHSARRCIDLSACQRR